MKTITLFSIFLYLIVSIAYTTETTNAQTDSDTEKYIIKKGDTLWDLSRKFYGNCLLWKKILERNTDIKDPYMLIPGQIIIIPELSEKKQENGSVSAGIQQTAENGKIESNENKRETTVNEEQKVQLITGKILDTEDIGSQDMSDMVLKKSNTALELLIASLNDEVSKPDDKQAVLSGKNILDAPVETPEDTLGIETLPVYSLIFISQANTRTKLKYFVSDEKVFLIDGTQLVPSYVKPATNEACNKARKVAEIIEENGKDMGKEEYESGLVYHMKRMFLNDEERYYNFILTNVNEHFLGFATLNEPVDVLHVRIFSNYGYIYITDKGLQGLPGYFYAADARGNQILIDPNDPMINEKYEKALDIFLSIFHKELDIPYDPQAVEKLNRIFN